jgi:hypothetical protein
MTETTNATSPLEPVRRYFLTLKKILVQPRAFFQNLSFGNQIAYPLVFALVTHWLQRFIEFSWQSIAGQEILPFWKKIWLNFGRPQIDSIDRMGREPWFEDAHRLVLDWFWGASSVIIDPFLTLLVILGQSFLVYLGAKLLVPSRGSADRTVTFENVLRILCYSTAPGILAAVPFLGAPVAMIYTLGVTVIAFCEVYRIGIGRGLIISLSPKLMFGAGILMLALIFGITLLKLFSSF